MPKQPIIKRKAKVHTPYLRSYNKVSSLCKANNILGIKDASNKGLLATIILLHFSTKALK